MFSKHRVEALSDGVFAIAMTLLVLDLKVPLDAGPGQLGAALVHDVASWISFMVTFALAAQAWSLQHRVFDRMEKMTTGGLALTFLFLFFVSVLPFTTSVWGHHIRDPLAFVLYFTVQFAFALLLTLKLELARWKGYLKLGPETEQLRMRLYGMALIMAVGTPTVGYLPRRYQWVPVGAMAIVIRMMRVWQKRRLAAAGSVELPGS